MNIEVVSARQPDPFADAGVQPPAVPLGGTLLQDITDLTSTIGLGAAVEALDGRVLTRGTSEITEQGMRWTARLTQLDRPGVIASLFFSERARDVVLRLDDGRSARARISSTSFIAKSERVCDLTGVEPLA